MRVRQLRCDPDLAQEALGRDGHSELWSQYLDRDPPPVLGIQRQIDDRHGAPTQFPLHLISRRKGRGCRQDRRVRHNGKLAR